MNILIIGGTGLISAPMTRFFLERGDQVTHYNRGQLDLYPPPREVRTIHGDRTNYPAFERQIAELPSFDCVIDMVGYAPGNGESVVRAFRGRVGHFIFCSTVDVYLKPASRYPYTENEAYGGLNTYSSNKVIIEKTLRAAHEHGDFPLTIIRPAYTYGEGRGPLNPFGGAYLDRVRAGGPIVVHGDGSALWTACHCEDVARAFVAAAGQTHTIGKAYHTPGEEWMTWNTYHKCVAEAISAPAPELVHIPTAVLARIAPERAGIIAENFQFNNIFDTTAARNDLQFQYTVPWVEGVRRMVAWLEEYGKSGSTADPLQDALIAAWQRLQAGMEIPTGAHE